VIEEDGGGGPRVKIYSHEGGSFSREAPVVFVKEGSVMPALNFKLYG